MQLSDIRTHVRRLVGEPTAGNNPFWTNAEIDDGIHFGENYVGSIILLPESKQTFVTVNGTREYTTLSAGTYHVKTIDYAGNLLTPIDYDQTIAVTANTAKRPSNFYLSQRGRQITVGIYPTPTAAGTVTALTVIEPTKPSSDTTQSLIPDMWMWAVILFAGMVLKLKDREFREARSLVDEMLRKLLSAQQNVKTMQNNRFNQVRDVAGVAGGPDLAFGKLWIP